MGMKHQPNHFEFLLASLMSHSEAAADPERSRVEGEEAGFWQVSTLAYFEQRLQPVGCDIHFDVALPVQPRTRRHRFALTLWPDFELGVLTDPDGAAFYPHFVRQPGVKPPPPAHVGAILPWSATLEEVLDRFGEPLETSAWDFRRWITYSFGAERWAMTIDLGLVQGVTAEHLAEGTRRVLTA